MVCDDKVCGNDDIGDVWNNKADAHHPVISSDVDVYFQIMKKFII